MSLLLASRPLWRSCRLPQTSVRPSLSIYPGSAIIRSHNTIRRLIGKGSPTVQLIEFWRRVSPHTTHPIMSNTFIEATSCRLDQAPNLEGGNTSSCSVNSCSKVAIRKGVHKKELFWQFDLGPVLRPARGSSTESREPILQPCWTTKRQYQHF
jgi:hypothetical protein